MTAVYVDAVSGDDANGGLSTGDAVKTPGRADVVMATLTAGASDDIEVLFKRGQTHNFAAGLTITNSDNRPSGYRLIYDAYGTGDDPVLTARTQVTGWVVTPNSNIVVADLSGEIRNLWTDDETQILKRATYLEDYEPTRVYQWDQDDEFVTIPTWALPVGGATDGLEIVIQMGWAWSRLPVLAIVDSAVPAHSDVTFSAEATSAEFAKGDLSDPGLGTAFAYGPYHNSSGQRFFWCSAEEFLTAPGDWFHDEVAQKLYVFLPSGATTPAEFEALGVYISNGVDTLFSVHGGGDFDSPTYAENIDFRNLEFKHVGWTHDADEGFVGYLSGFGLFDDACSMGFRKVPAVIDTTHNCKSVSVTDCYFHDLGGVGIRGNYGIQGLKISDNAFARIASSGIAYFGSVSGTFGGSPFSFDRIPESGQNIGGIFENNILLDVGEYYLGGALDIGAWFGAHIKHNLIKRCPDQGIKVGLGARWHGAINIRDIRVTRNEVDTVMTITVDGAGIYSNGNISGYLVVDNVDIVGAQRGLKIYGNSLRNIITSGWDPGGGGAYGVYLDLGSQGSICYLNYLDNVTTAFELNACSYNTIVYNRITNAGSDLGVHYSGMQIFVPGADTSVLVEPPLANPPSATDIDKFYGLSGYYSFKAMIPTFSIPEDVITTGGVYNTEALFDNNGESIVWGVTNYGPSESMRTKYATLLT